jgi:hypothetical protein
MPVASGRQSAVAACQEVCRSRQGQHLRPGCDDRLVAHPRGATCRRTTPPSCAARGGRRGHRRQDQLRRVRDGLVERELGVRRRAQPVGARSHARRIERRLGRGRGRRLRAARARLRHRRIDPAAGRLLRRRRPEADLRPRVALRPHRLRLVARSDRAVHPHGGRRRAALGVIAGADPADATSAPSPCPTSRRRSTATCGLRVGVPRALLRGRRRGRAPGLRRGARRAGRPRRHARRHRTAARAYAIPVYYLVAPPRRARTWRATTACGTVPRRLADTLRTMYDRTRDEGFGPR